MLTRWGVLVAAAALVAACGSSGGSAGGSSGSGATTGTGTGTTKIKIGLLTDLTGAASSADKSVVQGVDAGVSVAKGQGYTITYVLADTGTTTTGALAAAQKLVDHDHVTAVITNSLLTFAAAPFLTSRHVPVIGPSQDGPEWLPSKNMFAVYGYLLPTRAATTIGKFFKQQGATNSGVVGASVQTSAQAAKSYANSVRAAGLKVGYLNTTFPLGSTDVGPISIAMKNDHVDSFVGPLPPATVLSLLSSLRAQGVTLKATFLNSGYGGDLTQGGQASMNAAQGAMIGLPYQPLELQTAATKKLAAALKVAHVSGDPTFAQYNGYASVALLVRGLQGAGAKPTSASLTTSLGKITDFDGAGLFGSLRVNFADRNKSLSSIGVDNCEFMTKVVGNTFQPMAGASPVCGEFLP